MSKLYVQPLQRVAIVAPHSEVCMHMRVAGRPMLAEVCAGGGAAQLYTLDGRPFSAPVTLGEAGFYQDADGVYVAVAPSHYCVALCLMVGERRVGMVLTDPLPSVALKYAESFENRIGYVGGDDFETAVKRAGMMERNEAGAWGVVHA